MPKLAPSPSRPKARSAEPTPDQKHANGSPAALGSSGSLPLFLQGLTIPGVQAKLLVNEPNDVFEQEANALSESAALGGGTAPSSFRRAGAGQSLLQRKVAASKAPPGAAPAIQPPDGGSALNRGVRARVEPVLGMNLSGVRVHDSPAARDAAEGLGARAFTHKNHIWLGPNESAGDMKLLAHESTHVLQQSDGAGPGDATGGAPTIQRTPGDAPSSSLETPVSAATTPDASFPDAGTLVGPDATSQQPATEADASRSTASDGSGTADGGGGAEGADGGMSVDPGSGAAHPSAPGEAGGAQAAGPEAEGGGGAGGGGGAAITGEGGGTAAPPVPETGAGALETGDLVLIDVELAEHQRWAGALGRVGEASSLHRAEFVAEAAGGGFISGAASGFAMGLGIGLVTRFVPAIGPVIGGALALHGLATRDWAETGATIGRFGEGSDTYETLANTIASVAAVIDIVSQVLTVINGIVGVVQIAAAVIAGGAVVAAFFTFGATLGIAAVAGEVVATCEEISLAIGEVTMVLDLVNSAILQPCVTLFRALHAFTTQADPREVEAQGRSISTAAAASGAALGAWAGGKAAEAGGRPHPPEDLPPSQRPAHETPPPAAGDGPTVHFQDPVTPVAHAEGAPAPVTHAESAPPPAAPVEAIPLPAAHGEPTVAAPEVAPAHAEPQQLTLAGTDVPSSPPPAAPPPGPVPQGPHPITPDVEIRGDFSDASLRVIQGDQAGRPAVVGEVGPHRQQGARGSTLESEHVIPGAQMRDASRDPQQGGAPDWQRHTTPTDPNVEPSAGRDYQGATTIVEHAVVSARKTALDNPETRALQARGGPRNPVEDLLLPSLQRHQQAVDEAIAAGEITPQQATDPTHRALAAQAEMWAGSEATGGAKARADAEAAGGTVPQPRRPDRMREAEAARAQARLAGEHIEEPDWEATFPSANRLAPPGTQLGLPGMEHVAPRPGPVAEQLSFHGMDQPSPNSNQLSLPFDRPPAPSSSTPPPPPTSAPPPAAPISSTASAATATPATMAPPVSSVSPAIVPTTTAAPTASTTSTPATSTTPQGTTSSTISTLPAAAGAARTAVAQQTPGGPEAGTGSPTWGTRAHQVGELFLPQLFGGGGEAPTYAQQQAAHRARFTPDNQPAEGVERVNPEYPPPPATPAEITAVQNEIMNLLAVRASAEQEAANQSGRADQCEENQGPIQQTVQDTAAGISAVQAHDAAIARREAVNQEQQQRQQESQGLVAGYPSRATGLAALTVPLAAWEGFTSLASHLPGEAGDSMLRMNREARQMQDAFAQMGAEMLGVDSAGPAREEELQGDQGRLEETGEMAQESDQHLQTSSAGAEGLQDANEAAHAEATQRRDAATDRAQECSEAVTEREARADSLAEQLRAWAAAHAAARQQAIAATEQRLAGEGRIVVRSSER